MDAISAGVSALDVEWQRLEIIAQNLANIQSAHEPGSRGYTPLRLVSGPRASFDEMLGLRTDGAAEGAGIQLGVHAVAIESNSAGVRAAYEPHHPYANQAGYVNYPDVDHAGEMTRLVKTARVYEANLTAIGIARSMYSSALELGRRA